MRLSAQPAVNAKAQRKRIGSGRISSSTSCACVYGRDHYPNSPDIGCPRVNRTWAPVIAAANENSAVHSIAAVSPAKCAFVDGGDRDGWTGIPLYDDCVWFGADLLRLSLRTGRQSATVSSLVLGPGQRLVREAPRIGASSLADRAGSGFLRFRHVRGCLANAKKIRVVCGELHRRPARSSIG